MVDSLLAFVVALTAVAAGSYFYLTSEKKSSNPSKTSVKVLPTGKTSSSSATTASSSSNPSRVRHPISIFFGSQSGTAETFANELSSEAKMYGFKPKVYDLESYEKESALEEEKLAVFLMATFGEGEPTDNAVEFCEWINSNDRDSSLLSNVKYAVFALGNKQYEHFCAVGKKLDTRLEDLGGARICTVGEGDDDGSLEDDFGAWKKKFWAATREEYGMEDNDNDTSLAEKSKFISQFTATATSANATSSASSAASSYVGGLSTLVLDAKTNSHRVPVVVNRELRQSTSDGTSTKHIEFDISGSPGFKYITADNLGVYPRNEYKLAAQFIKRLGLDGNALYEIKTKKKNPFPNPVSVQDLFLWYLDFLSSPRVAQLATLAQYATNPAEKTQLTSYAHEKKDEYVADHKSWLEVFDDFPSLSVPLSDLLDLIPKLAPRFYTISSSSLVHPTRISITVALMVHNKPRGRHSLGICSNYLCGLKEKDEAMIFIRESSFRFPKPTTFTMGIANALAAGISKGGVAEEGIITTGGKSTDPTTPTDQSASSSAASAASSSSSSSSPPIIMVGPGTGIAPFRGFIQEAAHLRASGHNVGDVSLFFGCRDSKRDFIYEAELTSAHQDRVINNLYLAFSRQNQEPTAKKVYVQDRLHEVGEQVWDAIHVKKAHFFICGGTAMGRSVREAIQALAVKHGQLNETQAAEYIKQLQNSGRFIQELWS